MRSLQHIVTFLILDKVGGENQLFNICSMFHGNGRRDESTRRDGCVYIVNREQQGTGAEVSMVPAQILEAGAQCGIHRVT
jgi:hypothetical protein